MIAMDERLPAGPGGAGAPQVENVLENLALLGIDRNELCARVGLAAETLLPEARVPWAVVHRVFGAAQEMRDDPLVGLHAAEAGSRDLLGYLTAAQPTIGEAIRELGRFMAVSADGVRVEVEGRPAVVARVHFAAEAGPWSRHVAEYLVGVIITNLVQCSGRRFRPSEVRFAHAPAGALAEYERVLHSAVRFRQAYTEIAIRDDVMAMRLDTRSPDAAVALTEVAERRVRLAASASIGHRVAAVLRGMLARGVRPNPAAVATALGTSVRTLQRQLANEGRSLRVVRDEVRRDWALERLADASFTIAHVSDEIGFADVAAFTKAFRRWTGDSPRAYRRTRGGGAG